MFTTFWNTFILESTFGCDHDLDCYVGNTGQDPIPDCDLINPKNTSVVCYRLKFDIVNAIGNIGGTTFVALGGFGLMTHLVLLAQESSPRLWVRVIWSTIILVVQYTLFFSNLTYFIYFHISIRSAHQLSRITSIVNTVTTFIAAFFCITSPWVLVLWAWNKTRNHAVISPPDAWREIWWKRWKCWYRTNCVVIWLCSVFFLLNIKVCIPILLLLANKQLLFLVEKDLHFVHKFCDVPGLCHIWFLNS